MRAGELARKVSEVNSDAEVKVRTDCFNEIVELYWEPNELEEGETRTIATFGGDRGGESCAREG